MLPQLKWFETEDLEASGSASSEEATICVEAKAEYFLFGTLHSTN